MKAMELNKKMIYNIAFLVSCSLILVFIYLSYNLEKQIAEYDDLINKAKKNSNEQTTKIDTLIQKIEREISYTQNGKKLTSDELLIYVNGLDHKISKLSDSLSYYKVFYELSQSKNKASFVTKDNGSKIEYTYRSNAINIDTVRSLLDATQEKHVTKINKLLVEQAELKNKFNMYQKAIDKYGIIFSNIKEDDNSISYVITAPKVDSALILLPYYRKKLKANPKTGYWEVK